MLLFIYFCLCLESSGFLGNSTYARVKSRLKLKARQLKICAIFFGSLQSTKDPAYLDRIVRIFWKMQPLNLNTAKLVMSQCDTCKHHVSLRDVKVNLLLLCRWAARTGRHWAETLSMWKGKPPLQLKSVMQCCNQCGTNQPRNLVYDISNTPLKLSPLCIKNTVIHHASFHITG